MLCKLLVGRAHLPNQFKRKPESKRRGCYAKMKKITCVMHSLILVVHLIVEIFIHNMVFVTIFMTFNTQKHELPYQGLSPIEKHFAWLTINFNSIAVLLIHCLNIGVWIEHVYRLINALINVKIKH